MSTITALQSHHSSIDREADLTGTTPYGLQRQVCSTTVLQRSVVTNSSKQVYTAS